MEGWTGADRRCMHDRNKNLILSDVKPSIKSIIIYRISYLIIPTTLEPDSYRVVKMHKFKASV